MYLRKINSGNRKYKTTLIVTAIIENYGVEKCSHVVEFHCAFLAWVHCLKPGSQYDTGSSIALLVLGDAGTDSISIPALFCQH